MKFPDFMLDLETLGKGPTASVVQIGVCGFNLRAGTVGDPWTWWVKPHPGCTIDADTVKWWMLQSDEARQRVFGKDGMSPSDALQSFTDHLLSHSAVGDAFDLWAMPPQFDCVILQHLFGLCNLGVPWAYNATRDLRTLEDLAGMTKADRVPATVKHDAGADAQAQALTAIKAWDWLTAQQR